LAFKAKAQYRGSLWIQIVGQFFVSFFGFLGIYLLFERFGTLDGWSFGEVAMCFAVVSLAFALACAVAEGFDHFSTYITSGDFDRLLLRPRGTILQVMGWDISITRVGRIAQSVVVLALAISWLDTAWTAMRVLTLVLMLASGVVIFIGVMILGATICFFTVQGLEIVNIFTDGGREIASYPLTIYNKWLARFFTFIIPFGSFNYSPLLYLTGRAANPMYALVPLLGLLFIVPCLLVWRWGVRHYLSTGN
jgi:ABC-2 type transport system permease protein